MAIISLTLLGLLLSRKGTIKNVAASSNARWVVLLAIPVIILLSLVIARNATLPVQEGLVETSSYDSYVQGVVFPRAFATEMLNSFGETPAGGLDSLVGDYADEKGWKSFKLLPKLFLQFGSKDDIYHFSKPDWSFGFETLDPEVLRREHQRFHSHGLIKHVGL